jgi:hypothetical protein
MSSAPIVPKHSAKTEGLSHDEWWALFDELRLLQQKDYAEHGGPAAFVRKERDADGDLS